MRSNDYHFITHWRVPSTCEEVTQILGDAPDLVRWWPSVYLDVVELEPGERVASNDARSQTEAAEGGLSNAPVARGNKDGLGKVISLYTKGWLPYSLRWQFRVSEIRHPHGFTLEAWGDFVGRGIWTFAQAGDTCHITYDWKIVAEKPLLRDYSLDSIQNKVSWYG